MHLYEYEVKSELRRHGARVPEGLVAGTADEAGEAAGRLGVPVMLKPQVLAGHRGMRGLIARAEAMHEVLASASRLLSVEVDGESVDKLLVERAVAVRRELYLAVTVDDVAGTPVILASGSGGVDVEASLAARPEDLVRCPVSSLMGVRVHQAVTLGKSIGLGGASLRSWAELVLAMWKTFESLEALFVEANPVAVDDQGGCVVLDAKAEVDDNALHRVVGLKRREPPERDPLEGRARRMGITYVELDGEIAVLSGGAGITMALLDAMHALGARPANFLDAPGGSGSEVAAEMVRLVLDKADVDPRVRVIFVNLSLSGTSLKPVVEGFEEALRRRAPRVPMVGCVRATGAATLGLSAEAGVHRLRQLGIELHPDPRTALVRAVELARGGSPA